MTGEEQLRKQNLTKGILVQERSCFRKTINISAGYQVHILCFSSWGS
jgi:hypothetical protein